MGPNINIDLNILRSFAVVTPKKDQTFYNLHFYSGFGQYAKGSLGLYLSADLVLLGRGPNNDGE